MLFKSRGPVSYTPLVSPTGFQGFPDSALVKNLPANAGDMRHGFSPPVRKIPQSRKWQPAPIFLPGKFHEKRSLADCRPWDCKESDMTEHTHTHTHTHTLGSKLARGLSSSSVRSQGWGAQCGALILHSLGRIPVPVMSPLLRVSAKGGGPDHILFPSHQTPRGSFFTALVEEDLPYLSPG